MDVTFQGSPRPVPFILPDTPFSQRKRTPFRAQQFPNSPAKSCPPVSRVFTSPRDLRGPQLVSFKSERKYTELSSPFYNSEVPRSYFEQCFEVLEKLGQGSFGEVFKVRSREDGRLYAVKKSRQRFRGKWDRRQKLREVEKHERLPSHPNCVRFYKAWEERDCLYIQTELCQQSLSEYADMNGRLTEQRVWKILVDLLKGLKHLHDHNLCHFDIKPANIFVGQDGSTCKLGDFGLCATVDQDFPAMEGDSKYMAPELLKEGFGKPADVFSLGISMLELACDLELPSDGQNWHLLRQSQLPTEFIRDLSPSLVDLLSRMMSPDPEQRPTVDQVLSESTVWWTSLRREVADVCYGLVTCVRSFFAGLVAIVAFLATLFSGQKTPEGLNTGTPPGRTAQRRVLSDRQWQNDSFSDDEDNVSQSPSDHDSKFNRSWIQNSPMKYPNPLYAGPPIPLDYGESSESCNTSPEKTHRSSPLPRINLNQSYFSQDSSVSQACTPRSKSTVLSDSLVDSLNSSSRSSRLGIEPKNLMDVFSDSSD